jgi:hypothetical protein
MTQRDFVVLLGAGASRPAGIPLANDLTDHALRAVGQIDDWEQDIPLEAALNYVVAALQLHDSRSGARLADGVGIERLVSAVELLGVRDTIEIAPFVHEWDASVAALESTSAYVDSYLIRQFHQAVQEPLADRTILPGAADQTIRRVFNQLTQPRRRDTFRRLYSWLVKQVCTDVALSEPGSSEYLEPLIAAAGGSNASIATLNYDLCVETAAAHAGGHVNRFIDKWSETGELLPEDHRLSLLKLHGSIDWEARSQDHVSIRAVDSEEMQHLPALVYGQREKLRSAGPFLQLLELFRQHMYQTEKLIVIGYSFGDAHINAIIDRWMKHRPSAQIVVVDPYFPGETPVRTESIDDGRVRLHARYGVDGVSQTFNPQSRAFEETPVSRRLLVRRQSAEIVLKEFGNGIGPLFSPLNMG